MIFSLHLNVSLLLLGEFSQDYNELCAGLGFFFGFGGGGEVAQKYSTFFVTENTTNIQITLKKI